MKESKRVHRAINTLETMLEWLHYYMGDCQQFKDLVEKDIKDLEGLLLQLSVDQKIQNSRLAKKLKALWAAQEAEKHKEE
jgi:septal ring factor EnvC (AmiA/AmiB activator)